MDCFSCKFKNPDDAKFCCNCGLRLDLQGGPMKEAIEASVKLEIERAIAKYTTEQKIVVKNEADQLKKRMSDEEQRLNDVTSEDSKIHDRFAALDANISKYEEITSLNLFIRRPTLWQREDGECNCILDKRVSPDSEHYF